MVQTHAHSRKCFRRTVFQTLIVTTFIQKLNLKKQTQINTHTHTNKHINTQINTHTHT